LKVYIDTNLIIADAVQTHTHHANAEALFHLIQMRRWTPVVSAHGLSETYSVLTGAPFQPRISPMEAWEIIEKNVLKSFIIEPLGHNDFTKIIRECAANGWTGGITYDVIHVYAARKAQCTRIYTSNLAHFRRIAPDLHDRIFAP